MEDNRHYILKLDSLKRDLHKAIDKDAADLTFIIKDPQTVDAKTFSIDAEDYLKKRGYIIRVINGRTIFQKNFVVVELVGETIEIWHDIPGSKKFVITESKFTGLPLALDYFERL
jgi:hypothetical protein